MDKKQRIRCAIYTRKSVEDGLEQEFNSLDAQREAAENYIASHISYVIFKLRTFNRKSSWPSFQE